MPETSNIRLKTIPNSNLAERKRTVLRIHQENLKMVTKLGKIGATQQILVPLGKNNHDSKALKNMYRSKSATDMAVTTQVN